jgi:hypothetical protein
MPEIPIKIIWDFFLFISVLVNSVFVPLVIGFDIQDLIDIKFIFIFEYIPTIMIFLDIIITLNTAYFSKGVKLIC